MECLLRVFPLTSEWIQDCDTPKLQDESSENSDASLLPRATKLQDLLYTCYISNNLLLMSDSGGLNLPLLFQCGVSYGSEGNRVSFIRHQPLNEIPMGVHGMPQPEASILKNVKFLYHKNSRELIAYCANIHMHTSPLPDVIIVDNLGHFVQDFQNVSPEQSLIKLCCILVDTVSFLRQKSGKSVPLIISTDYKVKSLEDIIWRLPIQTASVEENLSDLSALRTYSLNMTVEEKKLTTKFEIKKERIFLTEVQVKEQKNGPGPSI